MKRLLVLAGSFLCAAALAAPAQANVPASSQAITDADTAIDRDIQAHRWESIGTGCSNNAQDASVGCVGVYDRKVRRLWRGCARSYVYWPPEGPGDWGRLYAHDDEQCGPYIPPLEYTPETAPAPPSMHLIR